MLEPSHSLIDGLKARYAEPQRHYHTWTHIEALLGHFDDVAAQWHDPTAVRWALYWHDAIYDPQAADNEDMSADLLIEQARSELETDSLRRAARIIRATKAHEMPDGLPEMEASDLACFLDIDLSILASPEPVFDRYEAQIRAEYAFVPVDIYRQARSGVLTRFLTRERLYFSDHFYKLWEVAARKNLRRSIARLERKDDAYV
jgi:predicted metal-dependent HD superfamily phosphohydrolase